MAISFGVAKSGNGKGNSWYDYFMNKRNRVGQAGFTVVELLIVIVVIAILAAIIIIAFNGMQDRARATALKSDLRNAATQLEMAKVDAGGNYPADGSEVVASLDKSDGTTYQYTSDGATYCITATNSSGGAYHMTNGGSAQDGLCPGHSDSPGGGGGGSPVVVCDTGFIKVPGDSRFGTTDFCVMKYEAKKNGNGTVALAQAASKPWNNVTRPTAISASSNACAGCHLITEEEWLTIAHNALNVPSNWTGGSVGSGSVYLGYTDDWFSCTGAAASTNDGDAYVGTGSSSGIQRRTLTLSNGEVIWDFSGGLTEWIAQRVSTGVPGPKDNNWHEWTSISDPGTITPNPFPAYATPAAATWGSSKGMGRVFSSPTTGGTAYVRGGGCADYTDAGLFYMNFNFSPGAENPYVTFRAAK